MARELDTIYTNDVETILGVDFHHGGVFDTCPPWDMATGTYRYIERLYENTHLPAGGTIIDVGCGTASVVRWLNTQGHHAIGVDLVRDQMRWQPRNPALAAADASVAQSDVTALAIRDHAADAVSCIEMLYTVPDKKAAIAEMARVLKPGGSLILADWVLEPTAARRHRKIVQETNEGTSHVSSDTLMTLLSAEFSVDSVRDMSDSAIATAKALAHPRNYAKTSRYLRAYYGTIPGTLMFAALPLAKALWAQAFTGGHAKLLFIGARKPD